MTAKDIGLAFHSSVIDLMTGEGFRPELGLPHQKPGCVDADFDYSKGTFVSFQGPSVLLWFAAQNKVQEAAGKLEALFRKTLTARSLPAAVKRLDVLSVEELPGFQVVRTLYFGAEIAGSRAVIAIGICA